MNYSERDLEELEKIKLVKEIQALEIKWYKRPSYLGIIIPFVLGLISLIYAVRNGYFDIRNEKLQLQKEKFEFEKIQFKVTKQATQLEIDSLTEILQRHKDSLLIIGKTIDQINKEYEEDKQKLENESIKRDKLIKQLDEQNNNYQQVKELKKNIEYLEKELSNKIETENALANKVKRYEVQILDLNSTIRELENQGLNNGFTVLAGQVLDSKSKSPIEGANVHLKNRFNENEKIVIQTNSEGKFKITVSNSFIYDRVVISVFKNGMKQSKFLDQNLAIINGKRNDIVLYLE